ncbi:MAG: peptidase M17 [Flavobacteriia bacterium]|nr:MAG: peptidase M17 [Flavobacteriia bacterium]
MTTPKVTTPDTSTHLIILTPDFKTVEQYCTDEDAAFFKSDWDKKELQFLRKAHGFIFVFNTDKAKAEPVRVIGHKVFEQLKKEKTATLVCQDETLAAAFVEGFSLSNYQFLPYFKDAKDKQYSFKTLNVHSDITKTKLKEMNRLIQSVFWARDRVNEPLSHLNAVQLAKAIEKLGKKGKYNVEVFKKNKIESLKMGGLLAVNKGSETSPTFTIIEYKPKNAKNDKPVVLVGKGVVYDTGGLSLKPTNFMDTMKSDMGGAACMAATIDALAGNKVPVHVIGLIPATDNRPGKEAYTPGDVIHMYDGTTVEVLNTDAEGRMILADALAYANKYKPELVIDAATLTGAAVRALGTKTSVSMGNAKDIYFKSLYDAGMTTHDRVFRLPFWDEWKEELKSDIADLKNLGGPNAGMITAGKFLEHFTAYPYIHLDIAGTAYLDKADNYNPKGGTGSGVRLLYQFLKTLVE